MVFLGQQTTVSSTWTVYCNGEIGWPGALIHAGQEILFHNLEGGDDVTATLSIVDFQTVKTTWVNTPEPGIQYFMPSWNTRCRGPNGEWLAPLVEFIMPA
jgi:hypothetical protein